MELPRKRHYTDNTIILLPSHFTNTEEHRHKIPSLILLSVVNIIKYQCGRLGKYSKTTNKIEHSTRVYQKSLQSIQLLSITEKNKRFMIDKYSHKCMKML